MRVLMVANYLPLLGTSGSHSYLHGIVRYFRRAGLEIGYILIDPSAPQAIPADLRELMHVAVVRTTGKGLPPVRAFLSRLACRLPERLQRALRAAYRFAADRRRKLTQLCLRQDATARGAYAPWWVDETLRHVRSFDPDIMIADYIWHADVFDPLADRRRPLKVIITHDVIHRHGETLRQAGTPDAYLEWTWDSEARQLRKADVLLAIQHEEAAVLKQMAPECEVLIVPMDATVQSVDGPQLPGRCLFVGSFAAHNVLGLGWFLKEVWPSVLGRIPNASLHVCGTVCRAFRDSVPRVEFRGPVEDLGEEFGAAQIVVVPLIAGSGLKIKLIEALSYGRACVSTSYGIQGVGELAGVAVMVANEPVGFTTAICELMVDRERREACEATARRYVSERLAPDAVYGPLVQRLREHVISQFRASTTKAAAVMPAGGA